MVPARPAPAPVRYAQVVLFVQGTFWAWGAVAGAVVAVDGVTGIVHGVNRALLVLAVGGSALAGGMAAVEAVLAVRLSGFAGACLSLAAALALTCRHARQYAESDPVHPKVTDPGSAAGPTSFGRHSALARG